MDTKVANPIKNNEKAVTRPSKTSIFQEDSDNF